ncbi:MAG TPA: hypothetical protein VHC41_03405 [Mycobacteriales bacterium]|jgi:hypothetical protein|nr:hypothetical protein [Mycobacteriales bacterium]
MTNCVIVAAEPAIGRAIADALAALDVQAAGVGPDRPFDAAAGQIPTGFDDVEATLQRAGAVDAVVVALAPAAVGGAASATAWQRLLDEHAATGPHVLAHAAWSRAAMRRAIADNRPIRVVHVTVTPTPAADSAAQAVAQLVRSAQDTPAAVGFDAFSVCYERVAEADDRPLGELIARLVWAGDTTALAGAELVVRPDWVGIRRHPGPIVTVSYGGPQLPEWVDGTLREALA